MKTVELEPDGYVRVAFTMHPRLLAQIDEAAKVYSMSRSRLIQKACRSYVDELIRTDWLEELLKSEELDVDWLIDRLSYRTVPGMMDERETYLTPAQLQLVRNVLETRGDGKGKNRWLEFCQKTGLDPDSPPRTNAMKLVFEDGM